MLAIARIQSRHAGDALTYICLDAPLWGTHDVAVLCCSSVAPDVRIWGSLPAGESECEREVLRPVAGLSIAGGARLLARRDCFVGDAGSFTRSETVVVYSVLS
jgi:hypothetical protein